MGDRGRSSDRRFARTLKRKTRCCWHLHAKTLLPALNKCPAYAAVSMPWPACGTLEANRNTIIRRDATRMSRSLILRDTLQQVIQRFLAPPA
jgi:hypothetical protein